MSEQWIQICNSLYSTEQGVFASIVGFGARDQWENRIAGLVGQIVGEHNAFDALTRQVAELTAQRNELAAMLETCECAIRAAIGMGFDTKGFRDLLDKLCVLREGQPK